MPEKQEQEPNTNFNRIIQGRQYREQMGRTSVSDARDRVSSIPPPQKPQPIVRVMHDIKFDDALVNCGKTKVDLKKCATLDAEPQVINFRSRNHANLNCVMTNETAETK